MSDWLRLTSRCREGPSSRFRSHRPTARTGCCCCLDRLSRTWTDWRLLRCHAQRQLHDPDQGHARIQCLGHPDIRAGENGGHGHGNARRHWFSAAWMEPAPVCCSVEGRHRMADQMWWSEPELPRPAGRLPAERGRRSGKRAAWSLVLNQSWKSTAPSPYGKQNRILSFIIGSVGLRFKSSFPGSGKRGMIWRISLRR
ncbi:hypothetical protein GFGA_1c0141 [Gluconobacter frateurii NBRC 103465]|nr:hypothetical protein GFGA_1c0141 [Gluconobacter frateurii NBRC 103465]